MNTPWSSVGYLTFKRTYARRLNEADQNSNTEEYSDTINRVIKAAQTQLNCGFTKQEESRLRKYMTQLKGTVAGRFLWQMGTPTVERLGLASLQNCAAVVVDAPVEPFTWTMDMMMLGSGVGYNIQKEHVDKLPPVNIDFKTPTRRDQGDSEFIVPDSREGWVALLGKTLKAAFLAHRSGKQTFTFSTQLIRSKGAPIKGFGGTASGPDDLVWGIQKIGGLLEKRAGKKLRPIDCLDIMNIIGAVVVAGNVRRSAQIAIGDCDDVEFLLAKRWDMGNIPSWRAMSNNSVVCDDINDLHDYFWQGYEGKGEPYGLINLKLSRKVGRLGEDKYPDKGIMVYNPCVVGDTQVEVRIDGKNETIRVKDLVDLFNEQKDILIKSYTGSKQEYAPLTAAWLTKKDASLIKVSDTGSGKSLICTPDHKVFTHNRGYVRADELKSDDILELA